MKKLLLALALSLPITACSTVGGWVGGGTKPTPIGNLLPEQLQNLVVNTCSVVMDAGLASKLVNTFIPGVDTAQGFARAICDIFVVPAGSPEARQAANSGVVIGVFRGVGVSGRKGR